MKLAFEAEERRRQEEKDEVTFKAAGVAGLFVASLSGQAFLGQ